MLIDAVNDSFNFHGKLLFIRHKKAPRDQQISAGLSTTKVISMQKHKLEINSSAGAWSAALFFDAGCKK